MSKATVDKIDKVVMAKVIIVGDSSVGKTTIRKRFMGEGFTKSHLATLGADFSEKKVVLKPPAGESVELRLQIWDIAGQVTFALMRKRFLTGAKIVIFVYDRTNKDSFDNIDTWMREVADANDPDIMPLILVGNKSDLTENLVVESKNVHRYIQELKDTLFDEETGNNIYEICKRNEIEENLEARRRTIDPGGRECLAGGREVA